MTCKCDIKLENQKFNLNIDLAKFQALDLYHADGDLVGIIGFFPTTLQNLGNNIYITSRASPTFRELANLHEAIAEVKNSFSCACLKSKIDLIKFVIADPRDSLSIRNAPLGVLALVGQCDSVIVINPDEMLDDSIDQLRVTLIHEVIHVMDGCSPCRSKIRNDLFNTQRDLLYRQYKLIHKTLKDFHKKFTKNLIDSKIIFLRRGFNNIINEASVSPRYDYALNNKMEFLAVFGQQFCFEITNEFLFIDSTLYTIKDPKVTVKDLRALYIYKFNLNYRNLILSICELFKKILSDSDNCDESVSSGIECSLSLSCGTNILTGLIFCCNTYNIYLDIDSSSGCCSAEKLDQKKNPIYVGSIYLKNQCKCHYSYSPYIDIKKIIKSLNNCCSAVDRYPINPKSESAKNFAEDLSNQIYNNLKNIIETSSEAKLFLNSVPCD